MAGDKNVKLKLPFGKLTVLFGMCLISLLQTRALMPSSFAMLALTLPILHSLLVTW